MENQNKENLEDYCKELEKKVLILDRALTKATYKVSYLIDEIEDEEDPECPGTNLACAVRRNLVNKRREKFIEQAKNELSKKLERLDKE